MLKIGLVGGTKVWHARTFSEMFNGYDRKEAEKIIALAKKHNAPLMSCSALRYAKEVEKFKKEKDKLGDILTGYTTCRSELSFKGIHALEQLYSVIGPGVKSVRNVGEKGKDIVAIRYKDGRKFILSSYRNISCPFQMNLYGTKGCKQINVIDQNYFYSNMLKHFVAMVETKKEPFPLEETLEIIKVLALRKKPRKGNREIKL